MNHVENLPFTQHILCIVWQINKQIKWKCVSRTFCDKIAMINKIHNIIPNFFPKSCEFYTIRSVGMSNDCMLFWIDLLLKKFEYF